MRRLYLVLIAILAVGAFAQARPRIPLAFVNCQVVRDDKLSQPLVPGVVILLRRTTDKSESLAVSNEAGVVVISVRPGKYCAEAHDQKGVKLELDAKHNVCFRIADGEDKTIGIVLKGAR